MADQEEDFSKLPFQDRFAHKNWKVRKEGYEDAAKAFQKTTSEDDPFFRQFLQDSGLWKGAAGDTNVAAQQEGLAALCAFLSYGSVEHATRTRGVTIQPIAEKGLNSMRAPIKQHSLEALMLYVEIDSAEPVISGLLPQLTSKQPKVVAANLAAMTALYHAYGVKIIDPKPVLKALPKVFGHADKNVRAEASNLGVELYRWLREAIKPLFWPELKPVQQVDLEKAFEPIKAEPPPKQERLLRSQQDAPEIPDAVAEEEDGEEEFVAEHDAGMDAYDLAEPVDIVAKAPNDLFERLASSKWKDRKEALEGLFEVANTPRAKDGPYDEMMTALAKCMKDANIQVVMIAANNVEVLARGLRKSFHKYRSRIVPPMLERLKEKKQTVADALGAALDAVAAATSLSECLEEIIEALGPKNKNPQAKLEAARFLVRTLRTTRTAPSDAEMKTIADTGIKLLTESTEVMRAVGAEILGTLMKIKGERKMIPFMESVDEIKKGKVKEFFDIAEVKAKDVPKKAPAPKAAPAPAKKGAPAKKPAGPGLKKAPPPAARAPSPLEEPTPPAAKPRAGLQRPGAKGLAVPTGGLKLTKKPSPLSAIGSPRRVVSEPQDEDPAPAPTPAAPKMGLGRGLAGRSLAKPSSAGPASPTRAPPVAGMTAAERAELEEVRGNNARLNALVEELRANSQKLESELSTLRTHEAELIEERTRNNLQLRAKDTQLVRARSDADVAKETVTKQTREIERLKRELSRAVRTTSPPPQTSGGNGDGAIYADASLAGVDRYERDRASKEIGYQRARSYMNSPSEEKENSDGNSSLGVKRPMSGASPSRQFQSLGSDGSGSPSRRDSSFGAPGGGEGGQEIHSWKRAAEVTSALRARIEQMKVRQTASIGASKTQRPLTDSLQARQGLNRPAT